MLVRIIRRIRSEFSALGECKRCGLAWNVVPQGPAIEYNEADGRGGLAFPLCDECFEECDPEEAKLYFRKLIVEDWEVYREEWEENFAKNYREAKNNGSM